MTATRVRLGQEQRRALILSAAVGTANVKGLHAVTPEEVAVNCSIPTSVTTIRGYFRTRRDLWQAVVSDRRANDKVKRQGAEMGLI